MIPKTRCGLAVVAMSVTALFWHYANAFEVDGLRSGMSIQEASSFLVSRSFAYSSSLDGRVLYSNRMGSSVVFCDEKLTMIQHDVSGGFHAFVRSVEERKHKRGKPDIVISHKESEIGEISEIAAMWQLKTHREKIFMVAISRQDAQISASWVVPNRCG